MGLLNRRSAPASPEKVEKEITIVNRLGLHARPAAMFVRIASRYRSEIWVEKEGEQINGKSIMGLMMLAAGQGSILRVRAERSRRRPGNPRHRRINRLSFNRRMVKLGYSYTGMSSDRSPEGKSVVKACPHPRGSHAPRFTSSRSGRTTWWKYRVDAAHVSDEIAPFEARSSERGCKFSRCRSGSPNRSAPRTRGFSTPTSWSSKTGR